MPTEEKYSEINLCTSIATLCRDLADYNNIDDMQTISNLEHLKNIYEEEKQDPKNKKSVYKKLNSADKVRAQNAEKMLNDLKRKIKLIPDKWQSEFIRELDTDNSVIVFAPTGKGKTYTSVKAFISSINTNKKVVYIAPYFYLAFQMLANADKVTDKPINFITEHYKKIDEKSNLYIGTSKELYAYFQKNKQTFDVGIFDEIHSISETYNTSISKYYAGLVSLCKEKIIGLSATVSDSDIHSLVEYLSKESKIPMKKFKSIVTRERAVPLYKHVFTKKGIEDDLSKTNFPEKSNENYMKCFIELRKKDRLPLICFQNNNITTWKDYKYFLEFLQTEEDRENIIRKHANHFNPILKPFVDEYEEIEQKISECNCKDSGGHGMNIDKLTKQKEAIAEKLVKMKETIIETIEKDLAYMMDQFLDDKYESPYIDDRISRKDKDDMNYQLSYIYNKHMKNTVEFDDCFYIPCFTHAYSILKNIRDCEILRYIPTSNNSFFVFGSISPDLSIYKHIKEFGKVINQEINKKRKIIKLLSKSEGIEDEDVLYTILETFIKGLEYGIGILITSIPFLLQIEMLRFLSAKYIGIIFASSEMAVGINYPLRSVLICSDGEEYPLSFRIQMEGRCGRRGKDTEGHIIYWNISNIHQTENDLPSMTFPSSFTFDTWVTTLDEKNVSEDMLTMITTWKQSMNPTYLRYITSYIHSHPYPEFDMMERFYVMSYFREWLKELHEYYYYCSVHNRDRALVVHKMYKNIRSFIQSLKVFTK
jgi:late competence protein required for DNA uptake (superfamily II DNA/RNA helicase)